MTTATKRSGPKDLLSRFGFHAAPFSRELPIVRRFEVPFFEEAVGHLYRAVLERESAAVVSHAFWDVHPTGNGTEVRHPEPLARERRVRTRGLEGSTRSVAFVVRERGSGGS